MAVEGGKVAKAVGVEPADQMRVEKLYAVVARSNFPSQNVQKTPKNFSFGALLEVEMSKKYEKVHTAVERSTFPSQNVQKATCSDHFWKFRCRKRARRCGEKHMSKSKVLKISGSGPLFDFQMWKKCTHYGEKHISKSNV